jgi:hypothetical protein
MDSVRCRFVVVGIEVFIYRYIYMYPVRFADRSFFSFFFFPFVVQQQQQQVGQTRGRMGSG